MSRIPTPTSIEEAPTQAQATLTAVKTQLGSVPNMFRIFSNSPAGLQGYVDLNTALTSGALDAATRERIALAVGEINGCNYCLAAHSYLGSNIAKLTDTEILANRQGGSTDEKADVAVRFAAKIATQRGNVDENDISTVKEAGYSDAEIVEIIAHVALNTLTNYVNKALETEIDFPVVQALPSDNSVAA